MKAGAISALFTDISQHTVVIQKKYMLKEFNNIGQGMVQWTQHSAYTHEDPSTDSTC